MLVQRLRRRSNIDPTMGQYLVFAVMQFELNMLIRRWCFCAFFLGVQLQKTVVKLNKYSRVYYSQYMKVQIKSGFYFFLYGMNRILGNCFAHPINPSGDGDMNQYSKYHIRSPQNYIIYDWAGKTFFFIKLRIYIKPAISGVIVGSINQYTSAYFYEIKLWIIRK